MTTPQPAALPELPPLPRCNYPNMQYQRRYVGNLFTADQMRAYALAALQSQPAATTKVGAPSGMLRTTCPYCENGFAFEQPAAAGVSDADLYGTLEPTIVSRYVVEKRVGGGFWGYCVKAGDGAQEIFVGHKNACEHVRQALQTACLDGAYMAHEKARAILALRPQAVPMTEEQAVLEDEEFSLLSQTQVAALLWVLWCHQGASSPVGQPIRFALGMDKRQAMSDEQVSAAQRFRIDWHQWSGITAPAGGEG